MSGVASSLRGTVGAVSAYTIALFVSRAVSIVALPIVLRSVAPDAYGLFVVSWGVLALVAIGGDLGVGRAAQRLAAEVAPSDTASVFATAFVMRIALAGALTFPIAFGCRRVALAVSGSETHAPFRREPHLL